ncbi:MAG: hypothetical protein ACE5R5_05155 [Nitrosarchaeum sp.]
MSKQCQKIESDFEKVRQLHLSIQRDFVTKMQSDQFDEYEKK